MSKIKVGDRVRMIDDVESGEVIEIVIYADESRKLRVLMDSGYKTMLPIELWRKVHARSK
jgi:hypothetical protein